MNQLNLEARLDNLDRVLAHVEGALEAADCPMKTAMQVAIAVEEVYVNIAHYAYGGEAGPCSVGIDAADGQLTIRFEDSGRAYDPTVKEDPDITLSAEDRDIGGLGILMVKKIMDSVDYRRDGEKNVLVLNKAI